MRRDAQIFSTKAYVSLPLRSAKCAGKENVLPLSVHGPANFDFGSAAGVVAAHHGHLLPGEDIVDVLGIDAVRGTSEFTSWTVEINGDLRINHHRGGDLAR